MTPELAYLDALQAALLASPDVADLVGEKVFDEVPGDNQPGAPPLIYVGPINRQRVGDPVGDAAWTLRARLYAESTDFGRREAWEIANAASKALEGMELVLVPPFVAVSLARVTQAGDVLDPEDKFKSVFLDVTMTIQEMDA